MAFSSRSANKNYILIREEINIMLGFTIIETPDYLSCAIDLENINHLYIENGIAIG